MIHNSATPAIEVDPETYEVRADGELLTCEPASVLPLAQRYFCSEGGMAVIPISIEPPLAAPGTASPYKREPARGGPSLREAPLPLREAEGGVTPFTARKPWA